MAYVYDYLDPIDGTLPGFVLWELYQACIERWNIRWLQMKGDISISTVNDRDESDFLDPAQGLQIVFDAIYQLAYVYVDLSWKDRRPTIPVYTDNVFDEELLYDKCYAAGTIADVVCTNQEFYDKLESVLGFEPYFLKTLNQTPANDPMNFLLYRVANGRVQDVGGLLMTTEIITEIFTIINKCFTTCYYKSWVQTSELDPSSFFQSTPSSNQLGTVPQIIATIDLNDPIDGGLFFENKAIEFITGNSSGEATAQAALDASYLDAQGNITVEDKPFDTFLTLRLGGTHELTTTNAPWASAYDLQYERGDVYLVSKDSQNNQIDNASTEFWSVWNTGNGTQNGQLYKYEDMSTRFGTADYSYLNMFKNQKDIIGYDSYYRRYNTFDGQISPNLWTHSLNGDTEYYRAQLFTLTGKIKIDDPNFINYYIDPIELP